MALDAEKRIPDTTLPANSFKDGDILYGSDMNRVVDTLKTAVNENYKDLKGAVKGGDDIYIEPIEGVVDAEGQPINTVDGLIKWLYDNKILNEGKIYSLRINDSKQFEYYDGESWKLATVGQQGEPGEGVPTGGLSGQFLRKQSDVSYDTEWVDAYDKPQVDIKINNLTTSVAKNTNDIAKLNTIRVNLLKPILQTQTINGVTCTNNGGTYTLNGTASSGTLFEVGKIKFNKTTTIKIVGCPKDGSTTKYDAVLQKDGGDWQTFMDLGNGAAATIDDTSYYYRYCIEIRAGYTCNNLVFKPMITTNLNATYDDFIACLGTSWVQDTTNGYYTQSIICSGITSKDNPTIDVVLTGTLEEMQSQQEEWGKILKVETSTDTLKFYASEATSIELSVMVKGV